MPRNRNRKSRGTSKGTRSSSHTQVLHQDLKLLIEHQKSQDTRFIPDVPDVPRLRFRADRLYNIVLSYTGSINTSMSAPLLGALFFKLDNASNFANYTSCFDKYRLIQVCVKFFPTGPQNTSMFATCLDFDDANIPGAPTSVLGYDSTVISTLSQIQERTLVPRFAIAAYNSGAFTAYATAAPGTFVDSASPAVQYFGLKYYAPITTANIVTMNYVVTMSLQFRNQRST